MGFSRSSHYFNKVVQTHLEGIARTHIEVDDILCEGATEDEVAKTIIYICSPVSIATNGSVIKVDGGSTGGIN